jgi:uncharacterized protein HemY
MIPFATSIKYMLAGYSVILFVLIIYLVSLFIRFRNLKRDIQMFEEIRKKPA